MLKRVFLLLPVLFVAFNMAMAQNDDDLPPPSSQPNGPPPTTNNPGPNTVPKNNDNDFSGFSKPKKVDWSKFIIEPDFDLAIGPGEVEAGLSPYVGYEVYKHLYFGGGLTYIYTGFSGMPVTDQFGNVVGTAKANYQTYGGGVFAQYAIWKGFFARAKFEVLHSSVSNLDANPIPSNPNVLPTVANPQNFYFPRLQLTTPDLLLGVGYNLLGSKNFFFPIIFSYNLLQADVNPEYAVYPHAWVIQLGFVDIF